MEIKIGYVGSVFMEDFETKNVYAPEDIISHLNYVYGRFNVYEITIENNALIIFIDR